MQRDRSEPIPLVDLSLQHGIVADEIRAGFEAVMERGAFIGGAEVAAFEDSFAQLCRARHCVGVANGTDAVELLLRAHDVGSGDEVVVPANTFVATVEAVVRSGATPVLADVDPSHLLLTADTVEGAMTPRTRAVIAVHLYGQIAPMQSLRKLAMSRQVLLLEDAAQAHGARQAGEPAGSLADGAAFSFYPGKNLGAYGDAGAVVTNADTVAARLRLLRNHGAATRYDHTLPGVNSRLDTLQAVVLSAKLRHLEEWNAQRRVAAARYDAMLRGLGDVTLPVTADGNEHAWHLYVVSVPHRDRVLDHLNAAGIQAGIHYPTPIHLQPAFTTLGLGRDDLKVAETAARSILSLPIYPGITEAQQSRVVDTLTEALDAAA